MIRNIYFVVIGLFSLLAISCGGNTASQTGTSAVGADLDLSIYDKRPVAGSAWKHVSRKHTTGDIYEEGFIENGKKVGTWTSYYPDNAYLQTITNYENGALMGAFLEFDERGRLNKHFTYENNVLSGPYSEFKNGRIVRKIQYLNGEINGYIREYNNKATMIKEAFYKNNQLDGEVNSYNEDGKLVLQYIYKNGQQISGGIVE